MNIKSEKELIEWVYDMHLQNLSGREDFVDAFKQGIEATIEELKELKFLNLGIVPQQREPFIDFLDYMEIRKILRDFVAWQIAHEMIPPLTIDYEVAETYLDNNKVGI